MAIKGVDISEHNGNVDFSTLQAAGVKFAIIRTGYGSDYPGQQDSQFENNVKKANACGMPWGAYHYSYARNEAGGKAEAAHVLRILAGRKPAYGVWYDLEDSKIVGGDLAGAAKGFCETLEVAGLYVGVYSSLSWWSTYLTSSVFSRFDKWIAQWNTTCDYKGPFGLWQYAGDGGPNKTVIGGKVFDMNFAYRDFPAITGATSPVSGGGNTGTPPTGQTGQNEATEGKETGVKVVRYNSIAEMPDWAKPTITKLVDRKLLNGNGGKKDADNRPADLDLSIDMIRLLVINDRAGLYSD